MVERNNAAECERFLQYPVKINMISRQEDDVLVVDVDSLEELKMISESYKKPFLYNDDYYLVVFDKDVYYRTKRIDPVSQGLLPEGEK